MLKLWSRLIVIFPAVVVALAMSYAASAAERTINLITAFPKAHLFNQPIQKFIDEVNQKGKGLVQIRLVGGPEVTPVSEQIGSVQRGINHAYYGSISYFQGKIDESRVLLVCDYDAMEMRKTGATAVINKYFEKEPKLHYLAYFGSGYTFYIYLLKDPKRTADGNGIDLKGKRIRGPAVYSPVFGHLGATAVPIHIAEMYSALERGTVDGIGWLNRGLTDYSWEKHLKYRVTPNFWQGDLSIVIQLDEWNALSGKAQQLLTELGSKHERLTHEFFEGGAAEELAKLRAAGMVDIELKGTHAESYRAAANESLWKVIEDKAGKEARMDLQAACTRK